MALVEWVMEKVKGTPEACQQGGKLKEEERGFLDIATTT